MRKEGGIIMDAMLFYKMLVHWKLIDCVDSSSGPSSTAWLFGLYRCGATGGGQVRQQFTAEHSTGQALYSGADATRPGQMCAG